MFLRKLCNTGIATRREDAGVLGELRGMQVAGNVGRSSMEELPVVLQLQRHGLVLEAMDAVHKLRYAPEDGEEYSLWQLSLGILCADINFSSSLLMHLTHI